MYESATIRRIRISGKPSNPTFPNWVGVRQRARVTGWRRRYCPIALRFLHSAFFLFLLFQSILTRVLPQPQKTPAQKQQCSLVKSLRTPLPSPGALLPLPGLTGRSLSSVPPVRPCLQPLCSWETRRLTTNLLFFFSCLVHDCYDHRYYTRNQSRRLCATLVSFRCEIGGIGQPMSLLLKQNPGVTALSLYDIRGAPGVAADISHVNTHSTVKGFEKDE